MQKEGNAKLQYIVMIYDDGNKESGRHIWEIMSVNLSNIPTSLIPGEGAG